MQKRPTLRSSRLPLAPAERWRYPSAAHMSEDAKKDRVEAFKRLFEFFKHLTTLSSGSILVVLALAEKFVKASGEAQYLFRSMFLFGISIATALIAMAVLAFHGDGTKPSEGALKLLAWGTVMSGLAFFSGITLLSLVVVHALG
jgi:hypothetical protein